ncbi:hypothetical protein SSS_02943 [Sarcoptes scabiei]|uniref:CUB domain-containing protein n=1 Tax=Sarcoptes scabiei TaxID=52283 RepID=A0A834R2A0_SARSC|nr:hypothetical protein SSS_02943 [Sarcoptes scabiei]
MTMIYLKIFNFHFLILISLSVAIVSRGYQEIILQRCLPKADMENVGIKCSHDEVIAIKEAFFTSSIVDQCPFVNLNGTNYRRSTSDFKSFRSCTDDLRLTLNSKCSGHSSCLVNLRKLHYHQCSGFDGWINLKYICIPNAKLNSYCNIQLKDNFGYVTNPGYPKYYPPYDCNWKIIGYPGQRVQIEILDLSIKEPFYNRRRLTNYECTDNVAIIEDDVKQFSLCGESKSNLIEFRSKSNELDVEFKSFNFSPTRGLLFKYTMIDCPTLKPPSNGYMYRNQSLAFYNCYFDYVFEDTGLSTKILFCQYQSYWNGTVSRCIAKENATIETETVAYALSRASSILDSSYVDSDDDEQSSPMVKEIEEISIKPITIIIIGIITLCVIATIIIMLIHSGRDSYSTNIIL